MFEKIAKRKKFENKIDIFWVSIHLTQLNLKIGKNSNILKLSQTFGINYAILILNRKIFKEKFVKNSLNLISPFK
ncbi:hypothetical protein BpHYR1_023109 [Brachionus plicatilis]|uniref:Uncharacterized protein n=1 Tax=Brachionus plicatilis TaxID=10195 RepID=A0A3M7PGI1_BRAPC|nr:hypothetical protein BpHYR1_023109 [Brachionus plicatilis]